MVYDFFLHVQAVPILHAMLLLLLLLRKSFRELDAAIRIEFYLAHSFHVPVSFSLEQIASSVFLEIVDSKVSRTSFVVLLVPER